MDSICDFLTLTKPCCRKYNERPEIKPSLEAKKLVDAKIEMPVLIKYVCSHENPGRQNTCNHLYDQFFKLLTNQTDAATASRRVTKCMCVIFGDLPEWTSDRWECRSELQELLSNATFLGNGV